MLYDVPAPAKLNLFLHVVGRRPDGYHLLQTVFRFVGLADTLHFDTRRDGAIGRATELAGVACADDLTLRAAHALQKATGTRLGAQITLEKRIPTGGGLGGGSSDAASVLIALNRLWNTGLTRSELMRLALPLGADVPVFVFGQSAFGQGVGEDLAAVELPPAAYLIAQPDASVPTSDIFRSPDLTRDTESIKIADFPAHLNLRNDLAPVAYRRYPEILDAKVWLESALMKIAAKVDAKVDAKEKVQQTVGQLVRMSGSGACLFAEFSDIHQAVLAEQEIIATMRVSDCIYFAKDDMQVRFRSVRASPGLVEHPLRHWIAD